MAIKSKEELINKINESDMSEELKIELMEDITDSFNDPEPVDVETDERYVDLNNKYNELLERYKARFMEGSEEPKEEEKEEKEETDEIIDIKEI